MILSHLARFLSLLVCLMPTAWKIKNMLHVLALSVYACYSYKHLHTKIFVCTLEYLCVGVTPESLPFAYKNKTKSFCSAVPVISKPLSYIVFLFLASFFLLDQTASYVQTESADQKRRQALGCVLAVVRVRYTNHIQRKAAESKGNHMWQVQPHNITTLA